MASRILNPNNFAVRAKPYRGSRVVVDSETLYNCFSVQLWVKKDTG